MTNANAMTIVANQTKILNHEAPHKETPVEALQKDRGNDPDFSFELRGRCITRWHCGKPMVRIRSFFKGCPGIEEVVCSRCHYHYCLPLTGCNAPDS